MPELGGQVALREPSRAEVERVVTRHQETKFSTLGPRLLELCICDEQGQRMFEDGKLPPIGARAGDRLLDRCRVLCGLVDDLAGKPEGAENGG